jgi:hypothetical protein
VQKLQKSEMMKIGLIDVDGGKFPNYALMKIASYHRALGDVVEWADPMFGKYDKVYMSKIFTFSPDNADIYNCEIERGGTGYDLHKELPPEIDNCNPDYSIYPYSVDHNTAYGFLTRGCPNKCPWCVVPIKEGKVRPYRDVEEIAVSYISLVNGCKSSVISLLIKRLHAAVNKPLLLFMEVDGSYHLSISIKQDILSLVLPAKCPESFIKDMDIRCGAPANLQSLYNRWLCAIAALELSLNDKLQACIRTPWPYLRLASPHAALAHRTSLTSLLQEFASVQKNLRSTRQPARRVELGNQQHFIRQQILSLISKL